MITVIVILLLVSLYITMAMFTFGFIDAVFSDELEPAYLYFSATLWPLFIAISLGMALIEFTIRSLGKHFSGVIDRGRNLGKWFEKSRRF